ncbi:MULTISPECIES: 7TM domain-containing protein [Streptomyces]|uniref:7TM domain-containing protein n=1 Tax=Streptomyces solicathayae TaxID=3081768 RepID=A0ABZ0M3L1_9ACTN|nr:7TM domain-containing protein [Streptomyces sp. HUAS YS2]WOX26322.1 7TM domain-containing protein [Streptomyces sp. HUAS YS2]
MQDLQKYEESALSGDRAADVHRAGRTKVPVFVKVLAAVACLGFLLLGLLGSPDRPLSGSSEVVGEREMVRISGPTGRSFEVLALIDTGASASSVDTALAKELGFDLDAAPRITVGSALGRERRPVVDSTVRLAGRSFVAKLSVNNRSKRETPVLLGRQEVQGLQVAVGKRLLTQPDSTAAPSALRILFAKAPAIDPVSMMALLPLAALLIVVLRVVVGLNTLGTFSPVLLALAYAQAGLPLGVPLTLVMFALGFAMQPLLRRLHLPRVARLGVLIAVVTSGLIAAQLGLGSFGLSDSWGMSLPVVVTAIVTERLWEAWDLDGVRAAATGAALTMGTAVLVALLLLTPYVREVAESVPLQLAIVCAVWTSIAGTYRGLRLSELFRFAPAAKRQEAKA